MKETFDNTLTLELAAETVTAFVGKNKIDASELPKLLEDVFRTLQSASVTIPNRQTNPGSPAVPIEKSVTSEYIICLEDGERFKSLKRHLKSHYNLTPMEYREKWRLSYDYPMVAPNYKARCSALAKKVGLGRSPLSDELGKNNNNEELYEIAEEIQEFKEFNDGWDGPRSKRPTAEAIENALKFLKYWTNKEILEPELAFSGTIALQMYDVERYTLGGIRFTGDGRAYYSIVNGTKKVASKYFDPRSESEIVQSVKEIEITLGENGT